MTDNPFSCKRIAYGCIPEGTQKNVGYTVPTLAKKLSSSLGTVKRLRSVIFSSSMYKYHVLFDQFCGGIESGIMRNSPARPRGDLSEFITIAFEAHFRLELWYALSCYNFKHNNDSEAAIERQDNWRQLLQMVKEDRDENLQDANGFRLKSYANEQHANDDDEDMGEDFSLEAGDSDIDDQYWN